MVNFLIFFLLYGTAPKKFQVPSGSSRPGMRVFCRRLAGVFGGTMGIPFLLRLFTFQGRFSPFGALQPRFSASPSHSPFFPKPDMDFQLMGLLEGCLLV